MQSNNDSKKRSSPPEANKPKAQVPITGNEKSHDCELKKVLVPKHLFIFTPLHNSIHTLTFTNIPHTFF